MKLLLPTLLVPFILAASLTARAEIVEAQWRVYQERFRFVGSSTAYTCDGIETTLKRLLILLGARDDARVESNCVGVGRIERIHRVKLAFAIPVPADETDLEEEVIPAQWKDIKLVGAHSRYLDSGDCELVEQFERQVMRKLSVKTLGSKIRCLPYRSEFSRLRLRLQALVAVQEQELEPGREVDGDQETREQ